MPKQRAGDAETTRAAVVKVAGWLNDGTAPEPDRAEIAAAVRLTARALAALAPGASVEFGFRLSLRCNAFRARNTPAEHRRT